MIPFEKLSWRWKGGGFWRQPDYGLADCKQSVMTPSLPLSSFRAERSGDPEPSGAREREAVAVSLPIGYAAAALHW